MATPGTDAFLFAGINPAAWMFSVLLGTQAAVFLLGGTADAAGLLVVDR
jgi:hypothetical protein